MPKQFPASVLLENIRSLHNVGSIFRTADGAGFEKVYLSGFTGTPPRPQISKVALGAEESVPWKHYVHASRAVQVLKKKGVQIVALETGEDSIDLFDFEPRWPLCLLVGNEVEGLSSSLLDLAEVKVRIPMNGVKESLNVSCAFSIAAYELYRKWVQTAKKSL